MKEGGLGEKFREDIFFSFSQNITSWEACLPAYGIFLVCLERAASNITAWSRACLHCQQAKIHPHTHIQPQPVPILQRHFSHLHIDLVGPLQYSGGFDFIFTVIDLTSKWMEAIPLSNTPAATCAKALIFPFWGTQNDHFISWDAIYFKYLVPALRNVTHFTSPNNSLSS
jgi:hypothetical protein